MQKRNSEVKLNVLVVDDEIAIVDYLGEMLRGEGYGVETATKGGVVSKVNVAVLKEMFPATSEERATMRYRLGSANEMVAGEELQRTPEATVG